MRVLERALAEFPLADPRVERIAGGLIHESFAVADGAVEYVLQRVSPIFESGIHQNIHAVTEHLHAKGIATLRLVPTRSGALFAELGESGRWRLETRLPGVTFETCGSPAQAEAAGALVAHFHSALVDLDWEFLPLGIALHETPVHIAALERALARHGDHRLLGEVAPLGEAILAAAREGAPLEGLPQRVIHGDLKFNNVLFAGESGAAVERAVGLIDLDTVSRFPLWAELGDAWRSWCNAVGEDAPEAEFDLELFRAAAEGYRGALGFELGPAERASLVHGLERIALELAARFAADALHESYFGWDPDRFASGGHHNLVRARGQLSLYRQVRATREERARILAE
jgi:Ser/Thr protein kinase RdoA (MazF antagonist)